MTGTALCAYLAGFYLIAGLAIAVPWRLLIAACWCGDAVVSLCRFQAALARLDEICLCPGELQVVRQDGRRVDARLLTGTTIMRRVAWFRMAGEDGIRYQALILASRTDPREWHRLQLVWQSRDGGFGHPGAA